MGSTRFSFSWRRRRVPLLATSVVAVALGIVPACALADSTSYSTPGSQTFTVPANVDQITISATGARGGLGGDGIPECTPGRGGQLQATFSVTPGSKLSVTIGGEGGNAAANLTGGPGGVGGGGTGGTGTGGYGGGGGGGASTIAYSGGAPLLVAGGGGGCGAFQHGAEGGGNDGTPGGNGSVAKGGAAGGLTTGGTGGLSANTADPLGEAGSAGLGGNGVGAATQNGGGGGGGGGYFGGGGGGGVRSGESTAGGGGGGSDFLGTGAFEYSSKPGTGVGNGQVTLSYTGGPVPQLPVGPQGAPGPTGPAGPQGAAGKIELVICTTTTKTVKVHGKTKKVQSKKCSTKVVSGVVTFTATASRATLSRNGHLYATGVVSTVNGAKQLALRAGHRLSAGRYTLTLTPSSGGSPVRTVIVIN